MADNYLEKKMEELRRGRTAAAPRGRTAAGHVQMRLGARRALVVGEAYADFALRLVRLGVRTALATDADIPSDTGLRLCRPACGPEWPGRLLSDWHGLDLLLADASSPLLPGLLERWRRHRLDWPHVSGYGGRLLLVCADSAGARAALDAAHILSGTAITATAIPADLADTETLLWLALPQAKALGQFHNLNEQLKQ
ncbi:MAG: hypothetical protein ACI305_10380 [Lepagella sp.]